MAAVPAIGKIFIKTGAQISGWSLPSTITTISASRIKSVLMAPFYLIFFKRNQINTWLSHSNKLLCMFLFLFLFQIVFAVQNLCPSFSTPSNIGKPPITNKTTINRGKNALIHNADVTRMSLFIKEPLLQSIHRVFLVLILLQKLVRHLGLNRVPVRQLFFTVTLKNGHIIQNDGNIIY